MSTTNEQLRDLSSLMGAIASGTPADQIDKTDVGDGITVSTVLTADMGWETGIIDAGDEIHVVEHYPDREAAQEGHERWVDELPSLTHVTDLGYGTSIPSEVRELVRS